ncbi:hypothetical protein MPH61_22395 [Peribacillus muralis]|uniref:hypothetical protein n=1 Tax=Peribacillus muralis TaxID=264697 RepID=UPI001F4DC6A9|nr:hypothetical protein [Peribacillus muralis]MCK1995333.1 hypothetical protein [Peribacillus muralis]MCK2015864.1 hypothetical protein [Peribacillus muralis]
MRKLIYVFVALLAFGTNILTVQAEKNHQHSSKGQEQVFDNFFVQLYQEEILTAVKDYYNTDSINIGYDWLDKNYDVVELLQSEPGREYSSSYILKFTVLTHSAFVPNEKAKPLGIDTVTLGVEPILNNKEFNPNGEPVVKFLNFQHNNPPKEK